MTWPAGTAYRIANPSRIEGPRSSTRLSKRRGRRLLVPPCVTEKSMQGCAESPSGSVDRGCLVAFPGQFDVVEFVGDVGDG